MSNLILMFAFILSQVEEVQNKIPLLAEISENHPLFIFNCDLSELNSESAREKVHSQWNSLIDDLKSNSALQLCFSKGFFQDLGKIEDYLSNIFTEVKIPCILRITLNLNRENLPEPQEITALFARLPNLIGISISDFSLNIYPSSDGSIHPDYFQVEWISSLIVIASRYGRFVFLPMNAVELVRLLSHPKAEPLLKVMKDNADYVIPSYSFNGDFAPIGLGAIIGLYLGGFSNRIGVECGSAWYHRSYIVSPCVIGKAPQNSVSMYTPLFRGMILESILTGSTVYLFPDEESLWVGKEKSHWTQAIEPTLIEIVKRNLVPSKEMVRNRIKLGYRCFPAGTAEEFWKMGESLFPQFGTVTMGEIIYGTKEAQKLPDIVPERGENFILPLFPFIFQPEGRDMELVGFQPNYPEWNWSYVSTKIGQVVGEGSAFITAVGKYLFVFNSMEHQFQLQSYKILLPSPVRKFTASRIDGNRIRISWNFREGDVSYSVYRRYPPEDKYELLVRGIDSLQWEDSSVDLSRSVAYSVSALTTEIESLEGSVAPGEYKVYSLVESRIAEEVVILPEMNFAESVPIIEHLKEEEWNCPDPVNLFSEEEQNLAREIKNVLSSLETAIMRKDVEAICSIFSHDYKDSLGSGIGHIKYGLNLFFRIVPSPRFLYQIKDIKFDKDENGGIIVQTRLFMKITGFRVSDPLGIKSALRVELSPPSEEGEVNLSWSKQDSLWVVRSSDYFPFEFCETIY